MKNKYILPATVVLLLTACAKENIDNPPSGKMDYRHEMRSFVQKISRDARGIDHDFIIIPQNGQEIMTQNGEPGGALVVDYLSAIDGVGREDLFYGYNADNEPTPEADKTYMMTFCDVCRQNNLQVLCIDYCSTPEKMDNSYRLNQAKGYISFAAPERELNVIPDYPLSPFHVNKNDITSLADAKNFLYLINPEQFATTQDFIRAVSATNYDLIVMDCFVGDQAFSRGEIEQLKIKQNSGKRLVLSYLSIGEAEDYRYYWQKEWETTSPGWLEAENPAWHGNYKVRYWDPEWQKIICGADSSYLQKIIAAGFDGAYLDIIDAFEYFEQSND